MSEDAICLKNISHAFENSAPLFSQVNLAVRRNERVALVGPSGQGKSTLLKIISGLIKPAQGQVLIEGQDLYNSPKTKRVEIMNAIGMLFQKNALFDSLTVGENLAFPLRETSKLSEEELLAKSEKFLSAVGLKDSSSLFPEEISGGMKKRVGIARALILSPKIILYDDPTAGLDPITSRVIVDLILNLHKESSATTLLITNDMHRAYQMADRIAVLIDGEFIVTGTVEETKCYKNPKVQRFLHGEGELT